jgi:hypothetical protein
VYTVDLIPNTDAPVASRNDYDRNGRLSWHSWQRCHQPARGWLGLRGGDGAGGPRASCLRAAWRRGGSPLRGVWGRKERNIGVNDCPSVQLPRVLTHHHRGWPPAARSCAGTMRESGVLGLFVLLTALATRGAAQDCTESQDGCATDGTSCSQFASPKLACNDAADGWYLFLDDLPQRCAEVEGAASVTCDEADNSRAVCATAGVAYYHTDNSATGVSDTCTECLAQPEERCADSPFLCMAGTCTGSDGCDALTDASVCAGTSGCTFNAPSERQCRTAAPGYYTNANFEALGARPSTHRVLPFAPTSSSSSYAAHRTLRRMPGGGQCNNSDMRGRGQQPRSVPPWVLQHG